MEGTKCLLFLSVGLGLLSCYVSTLHLYGDSWFNPNQDMSGQLQKLKREQGQLERALAGPLSRSERLYFSEALQDVKASIAQMEATLKVSYKDYLRTISGLRMEFESEKQKLRKQLVDTESKRFQAIADLAVQKEKSVKSSEVGALQSKLHKLTDERNKIAKDYATVTKAFHEQEQKMKQKRDQLLTEKGKLQQTLDGAKEKHSQALEALSAAPAEGNQPIRIPEQDKIIGLRRDITKFNGMNDRKKLKDGLERTRKTLEELLDILYKKGNFSTGSAQDLEDALSEMEKNTNVKREEQNKLRISLVQKIKQKDLTNYDDAEIAALKKSNEDVAALDAFQNELARRGAYLKGILEVSDLIRECSEAIRDANERNFANLWADAIQEARDSPIAQIWTQALREAMDSDFARAWADALVDVRDNNVSQLCTDAIREAGNINLAEIWTEAIQDVMGTSLAEMWSDAIKTAKESPFVQYCANALHDAKNALCQFLK